MTPRYAVFGHPIAHSLSPRLHALFAQQTGLAMDYRAIDTASGFDVSLQRFLEEGGVGGNVTAPDKPAAFAACATHSSHARRSGVVNTLQWRDGSWHGDNTDGRGLVRDLQQRQAVVLQDAVVLVLGAGGAAAGIAPALLDAGIAALHIANRTVDRANALCDFLDDSRAQAWSLAYAQDLQRADIVLHATSQSDTAAWLSPQCVHRRVVVDLNYGARAKSFLRWAQAAGATRCSDGLGMLVEQAAESWLLWHGLRPDTAAAYAFLRSEQAA